MRIGILTLPLHTNYGGILQTYALQTVLERMGHEASVITTSNKAELPVWKWPYSYPKRMIRKYILGKDEPVFFESYYNRVYPIVSQFGLCKGLECQTNGVCGFFWNKRLGIYCRTDKTL